MLQVVKKLKKIVMIEKYCYNWKKLWWLKNIVIIENSVIIEKYYNNEINFSSSINEGIKAVLFFLQKDFTHTKSTKSTKKRK